MAIIKGSIFGQIQKRVGNEVGYVVGKRNLLRSWNPNPVNPRTPEQQKNRNWLYVLLEQYNKIKPTNYIKYQYKKKGETQQVTFCRINKNAVEWYEPENKHKILFDKLLLSQGSLLTPLSMEVATSGSSVGIAWSFDEINNINNANDLVFILFINIENGFPYLVRDVNIFRKNQNIGFNDIEKGIYAVFLSFRNNKGLVSNSLVKIISVEG